MTLEQLVKDVEISVTFRKLRRIKILAGMDDSEIATLLKHLEVQEVKVFSQVVRTGEHPESIYLILNGQLRACTIADSKESTLATLRDGDFFGEISLLGQGPPSACVIANMDSLVLKISSESFTKLMREGPKLAVRIAYALGRATGEKMRGRRPGGEDSGTCRAGEPVPTKPTPPHHLSAAKELPPSDKTRSFPKD